MNPSMIESTPEKVKDITTLFMSHHIPEYDMGEGDLFKALEEAVLVVDQLSASLTMIQIFIKGISNKNSNFKSFGVSKYSACEEAWLQNRLRFGTLLIPNSNIKFKTWIDGTEDAEFVGVGARFGRQIIYKEKNANQTHVVFANLRDCCSPLKTKLIGDFVIEEHGNCRSTAKANNAGKLARGLVPARPRRDQARQAGAGKATRGGT
ncbi:unnamed protein product [Eruca vesicaria subsp. sativa]|uniref:Uncharacterized protein n=1 Tax=Eruca vesicaria subsp. sativa TaxID=29727 RepID=A0ABC8JSU6_ERUVS|nr:unnamed protein product [Eruca vesicaria subsp. sativa]